MASYFIAPNDLWNLIGTVQTPQIIDTRRREASLRRAGASQLAGEGGVNDRN